MTESTPLHWPTGWPRTAAGKLQDSKYRFKRTGRWNSSQSEFWTFSEARDKLFDEVGRLGGRAVVLSTNFPTDRHGIPTERGRRPEDNGVALYFQLNGKPMVMACDMHKRAEENMRSLTLSIEAMRQLERHGGGHMMSKAFEGFAQLEAPGRKHWSSVLGLQPNATKAQITLRYRVLAGERHPDVNGGSEAMMAELNVARDAAMREARG